MAGLLGKNSDSAPPRPVRSKALHIGGIRYSNVAAKFWPGIVDELVEDFPDCTRMDLSTPGAGGLSRDLLVPEIRLDVTADQLAKSSFQELMRETLAEIELLGPPSAVQVALFAGDREFLTTELPLDCVDSETFPYLLVWPLEWAGIPSDRWNDAVVEGVFEGEDRIRGRCYQLSFRLSNTHLSEGLYSRVFSLSHTIATSA